MNKAATISFSSILLITGLALTGCSSVGNDIVNNVTQPIITTDSTAIQQDVQNAILYVTTQLGANPTSNDLSDIHPTATDPNTTIKVAGSWNNYTITATNTQFTGSVVYSSSTGTTQNTLIPKSDN